MKRFEGHWFFLIILAAGCGGAPHEPAEPRADQAAVVDEAPAVVEFAPESTVPDETGSHVEPGPEPAAEVEPEPASPAVDNVDEPAAAPDIEPLTGTIMSRKGKVLTVAVDQTPPGAGAEGTLLMYFEKQILGMHTAGWLDIAAVRVKQAKEGQLQLVIVEEHSQMTVNGKKVNHFKKGVTVKLEIGGASIPPSD